MNVSRNDSVEQSVRYRDDNYHDGFRQLRLNRHKQHHAGRNCGSQLTGMARLSRLTYWPTLSGCGN